jgi:hypothetical protein
MQMSNFSQCGECLTFESTCTRLESLLPYGKQNVTVLGVAGSTSVCCQKAPANPPGLRRKEVLKYMRKRAAERAWQHLVVYGAYERHC